MFAIVKNGQFEKLLPEGQAFELHGVQYPQNWLNLATEQEKAALGIVDVVFAQRPDDRFYWVSQNAPEFVAKTNTVDVTFKAIAKDLAGLQKSMISQVNGSAHTILLPTDYMDSRKANDPAYQAPENWLTWRESVRTAAQTIKQAINAATDVDALAAINIEFPADPDAPVVVPAV